VESLTIQGDLFQDRKNGRSSLLISVSELGCESELGDIENLITTYEAEVMSSGESIDEADAIININCVQIILLVKLTI